MVDVVVIAGPAGVGKTSAANEVSMQLRARGVAHAVVDTDALDDVFPVPENQWEITERHLAFMWTSYREIGTARLILTGVHLHDPAELRWIRRATTPGRVALIRLDAHDETLAARVRAREIGSACEDQLARTRRQAVDLRDGSDEGVSVIETDGRPIADVASEIIGILGWQ